MSRNAHTVKMTGTVYSRIVEMREELENRRAEDDSFKEDLLIPMDDILEFLTTLEEAASGAMDIAIDNQTLMRTAVSKRLEEAIGVGQESPRGFPQRGNTRSYRSSRYTQRRSELGHGGPKTIKEPTLFIRQPLPQIPWEPSSHIGHG